MHTPSVRSILGDRFHVPRSARLDAATNAFFENKLRYVVQQTYDVQRPPIRFRELIPINTEVPEGYLSHEYGQYDASGEADFISDAADDLPNVEVGLKQFAQRIVPIGDSYQYDVFEIEHAKVAGSQLNMKKALAARDMVERKLDLIARLGDTARGLKGFLNHSDVPVIDKSELEGDWLDAGTSADEIIDDVRIIVDKIIVDTDEVETPDTLLVSPAVKHRLSSTPRASTSDVTVEKFILDNSPYIKAIKAWHPLATGASNGTQRVMAYRNDPMKVEMLLPVPFKQLSPQERNLAFVVNCYALVGGVVWYYPKSAVYADINVT